MKKFIFLLISFLLIYCFDSIAQQSKIDSLRALVKIDNTLPLKDSDTNKVNHLNALAYAMYSTNPDSTVLLAQQAISISEKINFKNGVANSHASLGVGYYVKGEFSMALENFLIALRKDEALNNQHRLASRLGNIGNVYKDQANYPMALDYYFKALKKDEEFDHKIGMSRHLGNIGLVYSILSDLPSALTYYSKALKIAEELGNKNLIATWLTNAAAVYKRQGELNKALQVNHQALKIVEELGRKSSIAAILGNIGTIYHSQKEYSKALEYSNRSLKLAEELGDNYSIAIQLSSIGTVYIDQKKYSAGEQALQSALKLDVAMGTRNNEIHRRLMLSSIYQKTNRHKLALEYYKRAMEIQDSIFSAESQKQLVRKEMTYQFEKKEAAAQAEADKLAVITEAERRRDRIIRYSVSGGLVLMFIIAIVIFRSLRMTRKQKMLIETEKDKSEKLLLNILPKETADELKLHNKVEPKYYETATVMFTDIKGFTKLAEKLTTKELIGELNNMFIHFDDIIKKYGIEKIKTIGDSYMCVSGVPTPDKNHAVNMVAASLEIMEFMQNYVDEKIKTGSLYFTIRLGMHSGPLVAGVVGKSKFTYDIWGDTVNVASRMESSGEAGRVNISESCYELVKSKELESKREKLTDNSGLVGSTADSNIAWVDNFIFSPHEVEAKNKGRMKAYFVERRSIVHS